MSLACLVCENAKQLLHFDLCRLQLTLWFYRAQRAFSLCLCPNSVHNCFVVKRGMPVSRSQEREMHAFCCCWDVHRFILLATGDLSLWGCCYGRSHERKLPAFCPASPFPTGLPVGCSSLSVWWLLGAKPMICLKDGSQMESLFVVQTRKLFPPSVEFLCMVSRIDILPTPRSARVANWSKWTVPIVCLSVKLTACLCVL